MSWLVAIVAGILAAPVGFALGTLAAYGILALRMPEREGRRGLLAGTIGGPIGAIGGFILGFRGAWWVREGGGGSVALGLILGIPLGLVAAAVGLVLGTGLAERRGITNYAGERAAWGLYYVAIPAGVVAAAGGFVLGWWLA
ncbi:MAG: hypothetical protein L6Q95_15105 [Planctomycetes bacterium]|nr:hypothetical protein [Planctomycetota bacterium]